MLTSLDTTDRPLTMDGLYVKFSTLAREFSQSSDDAMRSVAKSYQNVAEHIAGAIRRHEAERSRTPNQCERL